MEIGESKLTKPDPAFEHIAARTHLGQASWGVLDNVTCRQCSHWGTTKSYRRDKKTSELEGRRCAMTIKLTGNKFFPGIPHYAYGCRHYEAKETPPTIYKTGDSVAVEKE